MRTYSKILKVVMCFILLLGMIIFSIGFGHDKFTSSQAIIVKFMSENIYKNVSEDFFVKKSQVFFSNQDSLINDINTSLLEDLINDEKYVRKAEVYLDLEGVINVFIYFRKPFVKVLKNERLYYYDVEGVELPASTPPKEDLLVVSGDLYSEDLKRVLPLVNEIYNNSMLNQLIGGIYYTLDTGYMLSSKLCDLGIVLGKNPVLNLKKIQVLELFSIFLAEELGCDYCTSINLEYDNQIICIK